MKKWQLVANAVLGGFLLTAATATAALLVLMFQTAGSQERSVGLFGALFFQSESLPDGSVHASMGLANPAPLLVVLVGFAGVLLASQLAFIALKDYRARLIAAGAQ
jgi:hypothetical protein